MNRGGLGAIAGALALAAVLPITAEARSVPQYVTKAQPSRLLDSRPGARTADGRDQSIGRLAAGSTYVLEVAGRGGVPTAPDAVWLNVTAVDSSEAGFVTVYPCAQERPPTSTLNPTPGETVANLALVPLDASGDVCLYTSVATHLIADATSSMLALPELDVLDAPVRLYDSRSGGPVEAGDFLVPDADLPMPDGVAVVNISVTGAEGAGFIVDCWGSEGTSLVNYSPGETRATLAVVPILGSSPCLRTSATAHVIIDLLAAAPEGSDLQRAADRLFDSRSHAASAPIGGGTTIAVPVIGFPVPSRTDAVVLTVAAVEAAADGYLTVFPCGEAMPATSNVNFAPGLVRSNAVVVTPGVRGEVCVYTSAETHVIVDVAAAIRAFSSPPQMLFYCGGEEVDSAHFQSFQVGQPYATKYSPYSFRIWGDAPFQLSGSLPPGFHFNPLHEIVWHGAGDPPIDPPPPFQLTITDARGQSSTFPATVASGPDHLPMTC